MSEAAERPPKGMEARGRRRQGSRQPPRAANGFPTVGLLLADLHTGSSRSLWPAVADEARRRGMNLVCFAGGRLSDAERAASCRVYELACPECLDGIVSWVSSLGGGAEPAEGLPHRLSLGVADAVVARLAPDRIRWHPRDGFLLDAAAQAAERHGRTAWSERVFACLDRLVTADGRIPGWRPEEGDLGMLLPGLPLFRIRAQTGNGRCAAALNALREALRCQPRTRTGGFWHRRSCPDQMWLGDLYRAGLFLARWAAAFGEPSALHDAANQILLLEAHTRDPRTGGLCHAWDESRRQLWANPETGRSSCCWGRAMGWYALALVGVLELLPASHIDRPVLAAALGRLAAALAGFQDRQRRMWFQVADQPDRVGNFPEASATCMFAAALAKASRLGLLEGDQWLTSALAAVAAVEERFLSHGPHGVSSLDGTSAIVGLGGQPYRDGSFECYARAGTVRDDAFGLGSLLLASLECEAAAG
jgi:unsaturated rhamnogalacturonyl hydrolase